MRRALELNKAWHSRLPKLSFDHLQVKRGIAFAAVFSNRVYAIAIWSDPCARAFNHKNIFELRRMAISDDAPKNTASRMLRIMVMIIKKEFPAIRRLISYQDTEVHKGTIYKAAGWTAKSTSATGIGWSRSRKGQGSGSFFGSSKIGSNVEQSAAPKVRWELII